MIEASSFFDDWSIVHFGAGIALGAMQVKRRYAYSLLIGFEILENLIMRKQMAQLFKEIEMPTNIISDVVIGIGSYEAGRLVP